MLNAAGRQAHNRHLAGIWKFTMCSTSSRINMDEPVSKIALEPAYARTVLRYLDAHWKDGSLPLFDMVDVLVSQQTGKLPKPKLTLTGFCHYDNVVGEYNATDQRLVTLIIGPNFRPMCATESMLPGYTALLLQATKHASKLYAQLHLPFQWAYM
tara:strand:- start:488 stop:952 length:465 start_codon:yes stop_codon:yes gene_type:complete